MSVCEWLWNGHVCTLSLSSFLGNPSCLCFFFPFLLLFLFLAHLCYYFHMLLIRSLSICHLHFCALCTLWTVFVTWMWRNHLPEPYTVYTWYSRSTRGMFLARLTWSGRVRKRNLSLFIPIEAINYSGSTFLGTISLIGCSVIFLLSSTLQALLSISMTNFATFSVFPMFLQFALVYCLLYLGILHTFTIFIYIINVYLCNIEIT